MPSPASDAEHVVDDVFVSVETMQTGEPPCLKCGLAAIADEAVMPNPVSTTVKQMSNRRISHLVWLVVFKERPPPSRREGQSFLSPATRLLSAQNSSAMGPTPGRIGSNKWLKQALLTA